MVRFILLSFFFLFVILANCSAKVENGCFRAAVLDHVQQSSLLEFSEHSLELNLRVYEEATALAKSKNADIIVFPENGLIYSILFRTQANHYAENIPNEKANICKIDTKEIINRLSCLAQKHEIFIAADLIDRQRCNKTDPNCPSDHQYLFNTAVLFDRNGSLIAKYHKMHLFGEMALNLPPEPELIVVDTELGRLGMQICFDMIYNTPGHLLAQENKIDTMIFPTWWFDETPFLSASQYQMAWALGNNISLLASNIHRVELGSRGSGIYVGPQKEFVHSTYNDKIERLVLANVPVNSHSATKCSLEPEIITVPQQIPSKDHAKYSHKSMNLSKTRMLKLEEKQDVIEICYDGLCCSLEYQLEPQKYKHFHFLIGNRTRPGDYHWTEEFCSLVTYNGKEFVDLDPNDDLLRFSHVKISGNFSSTTTVYPSAVGPDGHILPLENNWDFWQTNSDSEFKQFTIEFKPKEPEPLAVLALYGRDYSRDPSYERKAVKINL